LNVRRVPSSIARASTALRLTRRDCTNPMSKGMGEFVARPVRFSDLDATVDRDRTAIPRGRLAFTAGLEWVRIFFIEPLTK
jgi:hypothetical protein